MAVTGKYITPHNIDNWADDVTQVEMQEIIDRVEQTVERITGDFFYVKTFHQFLDGNGKIQMFPQLSSKILSINKMVISDMVVSTVDVTGANSSGSSGDYVLNLTKSDVILNYYQNDFLGIYDGSATEDYYWGARIVSNTTTSSGVAIFTIAEVLPITVSSGDTISLINNWDYDSNCIYRNKPFTSHEPGTLMEPYEFFDYDVFPKGKNNIEIWGTMGHYSCPLDIKKACIILCRAENDETLYSHSGYGMKSEKLGDYSYTRFDLQKSSKVLTGISEVDQLLSRYIIKKPRLGVT